MLPQKTGEEFSVWIKPGAQHTELVGYHHGREAYEIRISARPQNQEANKQLLEFLRNDYNIKCEIIRGVTSRKKRLKIL